VGGSTIAAGAASTSSNGGAEVGSAPDIVEKRHFQALHARRNSVDQNQAKTLPRETALSIKSFEIERVKRKYS
jgi:hypothetical protein